MKINLPISDMTPEQYAAWTAGERDRLGAAHRRDIERTRAILAHIDAGGEDHDFPLADGDSASLQADEVAEVRRIWRTTTPAEVELADELERIRARENDRMWP